jgi:hypothetical protein
MPYFGFFILKIPNKNEVRASARERTFRNLLPACPHSTSLEKEVEGGLET